MENINALDEIHKGACMGVDSIDMILDKAQDEEFKNNYGSRFGGSHFSWMFS